MISIRARTIAIIGAGPSGLAAARYLRAENAFDKITVFEQRSSTGGIWIYTPDETNEDLFTVPQTDPSGKNQDPVWRDADRGSYNKHAVNGFHQTASFLSPIYERLETNIPRGLMGFQDLNWPSESQLFPKHQTVLEYIEEYGKPVQDLVEYETQVINVEAADTSDPEGWLVQSRNLRSNKDRKETYDAVVVANGHFIVPHVPDIPGLKEWSQKFPGAITHSKYYRKPEHFERKKVIVVGNSASGLDISSQIAAFSQQPLLWSSRSPSMFQSSADQKRKELPPIAMFTVENRGVIFEDGTAVADIDAVVFATGYFYSLPFLKNVKPALIRDGSHVEHTYQHLFFAPRPSLSFLTLPQRIIPFPISEAQSAVLARVYSGRLDLPPLSEMQKWEEQVVQENGNGKNFHLLPYPKDGNYINELSTWASTALPRKGLENDGQGKAPPIWGDWEFWCRENFPNIRKAFGARGEDRYHIRSLQELGFSYEEHVRKKGEEEGKLI